MKKIVLMLAIFLTNVVLFAQKSEKVNVVFNVLQSDSNVIENATVLLLPSAGKDRYYAQSSQSVKLPVGQYLVKLYALGYYDSTLSLNINQSGRYNIVLRENLAEQPGFILRAISAPAKSGFVYTKMSAKQLNERNLGQDFTYLVSQTPSAFSTSDAGNGIGYTGLRIRGADGTRINVNINGVPINDAESHGVFWVNMPDLASSTSSVQVQRGVGSSTNGIGAFGANINISNIEQNTQPFLHVNQSVGSFNTSKTSLMFGTGTINNFTFSGRLSKLKSDGYIDRASSDLSAFQFNLAYRKKQMQLHFVSFGGKEKTYQSWYGTPESRVNGDVQGMNDFADRNGLDEAERTRLLNSSRTYNNYTYPNQTDNYWQNHHQLHFLYDIKPHLKLKSTFFLTTGKGYYEEFKAGESFSKYGVNDLVLNNDTFNSSDLIRQRWLDNVFYGNFTSLSYQKNKLGVDVGVNVSRYDGKHFGDVIWAEFGQAFGNKYRYYNNSSLKEEFNSFVKANYQISKKLKVEGEIQARLIQYQSKGVDNYLKNIDFNEKYNFINPKLAAVYDINKYSHVYSSYSVANREPVRSDFTDHLRLIIPKHENLRDLELGYIYSKKNRFFQINLYQMDYRNQLILTGQLNDVGASLRTNVPESYRRGVELLGKVEMIKKVWFEGNVSFSDNRIKKFTDVYYDYLDFSEVRTEYTNTPIAYSPNVILFGSITDKHIKDCQMTLSYKYVGKQYLDNTGNRNHIIKPFGLFDFVAQKQVKVKGVNSLSLKLMVNNLLGVKYSNNGYTFKYAYSGTLVEERFFYPQALRNFLIGLEFKL